MSQPHSFHRSLAARVGVFGALAAATGFVACSSSGTQGPTVSAASNPAAVTLDLRDANNEPIGSCTGTLISDSVVLTAGHCVVAMTHAIVSTADGQTAGAGEVWTTWDNFQSPLAHPLHSDIGVILLDQRIDEPSYPTLSSTTATDGQVLARLRRADAQSVTAASYEQVTEAVHLGDAMGFPLAYTMDPASFEGQTDTGGALIDPNSNTVYGVVSSVGMTTGKVYVSRLDYLAAWVANISQCSPPPIQTQCHHMDGGTSSSSSSGGSNGSGSSGGSSGGGSGGSSGGESSSGSSGGGWSSSGAGSSSGSSSGGVSSSSGGGGGGGPCRPPPPPPPPSGGGDDGGSNGDDGGTSSGGGSGGLFGGSSGGGSSGSSSGIFGGSSSGSGNASSSGSGSSGGRVPTPGYPLVPDGPGCYDDTCGGCTDDPGCQDGLQDYGGCGCEPGTPDEAGPTQ